MPDIYKYQFASFTIIGPFKKAPEPDFPGQPRKPEMEGVARVEGVDGAGGKTGHVFYMVDSPLAKVGVLEGEILVKDENGGVHVLYKQDPKGPGLVNKANSAGPYMLAPAPTPSDIEKLYAELDELKKRLTATQAELSRALQAAEGSTKAA